MDTFSVINYQGSKKLLLDFIHKNTCNLIDEGSAILDIFSGSCSVGYSYKRTNRVLANDSEYYSYVIANALLSPGYMNFYDIISKIEASFLKNMERQRDIYTALKKDEEQLIVSGAVNDLVDLYREVPSIWNGKIELTDEHKCCELFTVYFSGTYFGIAQAMEIDSIRYAIEEYRGSAVFFALLTSLFYAMKECVFSKDGHMAQPLDPQKNQNRLLLTRKKSIYNAFTEKLSEFFSETFVTSERNNIAFNMNFEDLLLLPEIKHDVDFIYADPPYTDMQYSRYYHLLNIAALYNYPKPSVNNGNYTKGLYVEGRYQSKLSQKSSCFKHFLKLIDFSYETKKNLAISFAYPTNINEQKTDRYVMDVQDIIDSCRAKFTAGNVDVATLNYSHSNNRNSEPKKVLEYLILCKGK